MTEETSYIREAFHLALNGLLCRDDDPALGKFLQNKDGMTLHELLVGVLHGSVKITDADRAELEKVCRRVVLARTC